MHVRHVEKFILQCLLPIRNTKGLHSGPRCSSSTPEQALREPPSLRTFVLAWLISCLSLCGLLISWCAAHLSHRPPSCRAPAHLHTGR